MGDNRNYTWENEEIIWRPEFPFIRDWIKKGSSVIDLGCGNGSLLRILAKERGIKGQGIELSQSGVEICRKHGLDVRQGRIDFPLNDIKDTAFEYAVCNVTIQMVLAPEVTLQEIKRIARYQIISFPNFAFLYQRMQLLFSGKMPSKLLYGYQWHTTGHIHQLSIKDFKNTISALGMRIIRSVYLFGRRKLPIPLLPNLLSTEGIFLLERK